MLININISQINIVSPIRKTLRTASTEISGWLYRKVLVGAWGTMADRS